MVIAGSAAAKKPVDRRKTASSIRFRSGILRLLSRSARYVALNRLKAQVRACGCQRKAVFFFFETDFAGRVKARPADRNLAGDGQRRAFTPAVILFIALPDTKDNIDPG